MAQLRLENDRFEKIDGQIIVIGPEAASKFQRYWEKEQLPFIGLPDPTHQVLDLFGQQVKIFKLGRMPAQVIVDKKGIVRYVHYGNSMSDIPENKEILSLLEQLNRDL